MQLQTLRQTIQDTLTHFFVTDLLEVLDGHDVDTDAHDSEAILTGVERVEDAFQTGQQIRDSAAYEAFLQEGPEAARGCGVVVDDLQVEPVDDVGQQVVFVVGGPAVDVGGGGVLEGAAADVIRDHGLPGPGWAVEDEGRRRPSGPHPLDGSVDVVEFTPAMDDELLVGDLVRVEDAGAPQHAESCRVGCT
jgi:hypothetical protein